MELSERQGVRTGELVSYPWVGRALATETHPSFPSMGGEVRLLHSSTRRSRRRSFPSRGAEGRLLADLQRFDADDVGVAGLDGGEEFFTGFGVELDAAERVRCVSA